MIKVSIVIPCYNHGPYVVEALDSVKAQTFTNYEVVIVDDGSTEPETCALIDNLNQEKVRVFHTENRGVSAARNRAITEAVGEYILPLDADDRIAPEYLELAAGILDDDSSVAVVYGEQQVFGEQTARRSLPVYSLRRLLVENMIHASAMFRRADWEKAGGYCEEMLAGWEDWEFWLSLAKSGGKVVRLPETLLFYRVSLNSRDRSLDFWQKVALYARIVRRHRDLYLKNMPYVMGCLLVGRLSAVVRCFASGD